MTALDMPSARAASPADNQTVIEGDCLKVLETLPTASVDVVVTSPPYNLGIVYGAYRDDAAREEYVAWLVDVARRIRRVLRDDGSFFLNVGGTSSDPWGPMEIALALRDDWALQNHILWVKSISVGDTSHGHYKPVNSARYLNHTHEAIFHFTKSGEVRLDRLAVGVPFQDKSNIARRGHAGDRRCAGNIWFIPYRTVHSKAQKHHHPSTFPVELPERCIRLHGKTAPTVLDPFLGTGTTLLACARLGATGIGIEIDPAYAAIARERLAELDERA